jgi:hypothetical protein
LDCKNSRSQRRIIIYTALPLSSLVKPSLSALLLIFTFIFSNLSFLTYTLLLFSSVSMSSESSPDLGMAAYRPPSLFQPHRARQALQDAHTGKIDPLTGCYLALSTVQTARLIASLGFDMVWIDWEHSACDVETMTTVRPSLIQIPRLMAKYCCRWSTKSCL